MKVKKQRHARTALLLGALDVSQDLANGRAKSAENKAGFLAITSGILISSGIWAPHPNLGWWVTGIPLVLSLASLACAALALRIKSRPYTEPQALAGTWLDDDSKRADALARLLVQAKARDAAATDTATQDRIRWVKAGLHMLVAALVASGALYVIENSINF